MDGMTPLGEQEGSRHYLTFTGTNGSITTKDVNLIPTGPLVVAPFEEQLQTDDPPSYHGELEYGLYADAHAYGNVTGQWQFYYKIDKYCHSTWDINANHMSTEPGLYYCYSPEKKVPFESAIAQEYHDKAIKNYDGWFGRPWNFSAQMQQLTSRLQGQRVTVTMPDGDVYQGRCWVSKYDPNENGEMMVTISYDLYPPTGYPG